MLSLILKCFKASYRKLPLFRSGFFLACLCMFLVQFISVYRQYKEYNFAISVEEQVRKDIIFPAVQVCVDSWMDKQRLCAFTNGKCSKRDMTYTVTVYYVQTIPDLRKYGAFPAHELFNCTIRHNSCPSFDCMHAMKITYFRLPSQLCYGVDVNQYMVDSMAGCTSPWEYELELKYHVNRSRVMTFTPLHSFPLIVSAPYMAPLDRLTPLNILPGLVYEISMKQNRIIRLKEPYKSRCSDYTALGYRPEFGGYLNYDLCLQNCSMALEVEHCKCIRSNHEYAASQRHEICNFTMGDTCASELQLAYDKCFRECGMPCEQVSYDLKITSLSLEEGKTASQQRDKFTVRLKFRSDAEEITQYLPALSYTEVLAYVGAYMGTWLGVSLLHSLLSLEDFLHEHNRDLRRAIKAYLRPRVAPTPDIVEEIRHSSSEED